MPDDPVGQEAFAVIRDAMEADDVVGISKLAIVRRERAFVLESRGEGIVLWTLRFGDEVRPERAISNIDEDGDPEHVPMVQKLIKQKTAKWSPTMVSDPIQEALLSIIAEKKRALKPAKKSRAKPDGAPPKRNVINIMDALRQSLADESKSRKAA
jgi:DNA end-binding protein Ku